MLASFKKHPYYWGFGVGIGLILLAGGSIVIWGKSRGWRNNNPGDVENLPGDQTWHGQPPGPTGKDGRFAKFDTLANGLRACAMVSLSYFLKDGIRTLREFGSRFAPASDNQGDDQYGVRLAKIIKVSPDDPFDYSNKMPELLHAIIINEQGIDPLPRSYVVDASLTAFVAHDLKPGEGIA